MNFLKHNFEILKRRTFGVGLNKLVAHAWVHPSGRPNFGDELFYEIVNKMANTHIDRGTGLHANFYPGGSVLHLLNEGDTAWGVGLNNPRFHFMKIFPRDVAILGVRGPVTQAFIKYTLKREEPQVIGDPAILLPILFPEYNSIRKKHSIGVVLHFNDKTPREISDDILYIDPLRSPKAVISDILSCDIIISSSLHGIIVAEAFGIDAYWYRSSFLPEPPFKFFDYYLYTGRVPNYITDLSFSKFKKQVNNHVEFDVQSLLKTFPG